MDLRKLKTLIELVESSGIAELEISEGEERVRITRTVAQGQQLYAAAAAHNRLWQHLWQHLPPQWQSAPSRPNPRLRKATWSNHPWLAPSIVPLPRVPRHLWM